MQVTCPNCGARYRVDASHWPTEAGPDGAVRHRPRKARCRACATVFDAVPEEEILELGDPIAPPASARREAAPAPPPEPEPEPAPAAPAAPAVAAAGLNPIEAAWPAVSGWPEPAAPGVIHFEAPPVPLPATATATATATGAAAGRPVVRLPGPGALVPPPAPMVIEASGPPPGPVIPPVEADELPDDPEEEEDARRRWPWVLAALLLLGAGWWWLVASGRVDPTAYGLPPYDPSRLPGWAQPAAQTLAGAGGLAIAMPSVQLPSVKLPSVRLPSIEVPRTPPPPLNVAAEAVRRPLGTDRQVWEISATISNPTDGGLGVPPVEMLLLDSAGRTVGRWTVRPEAAWLPPGGITRFETSAIAPPAGAERVRVQLKPSDPGRL